MKRGGANGFSVLGVGAAACLACCAGPILAFLTGLSVAGLVGTTLIGTAGLVLGGLALAGRLLVGRRAACPVPVEVPVAAPTRRLADLERSTR